MVGRVPDLYPPDSGLLADQPFEGLLRGQEISLGLGHSNMMLGLLKSKEGYVVCIL